MKVETLPNKVSWFKYLFCAHEFASDPLQIYKVCQLCGWPSCGVHPDMIHRMLYRIDKRGKIVGDLFHKTE
jgi:hypothetical protein